MEPVRILPLYNTYGNKPLNIVELKDGKLVIKTCNEIIIYNKDNNYNIEIRYSFNNPIIYDNTFYGLVQLTNERLCLSNRIDLIILEISEGIKEIQTLKSHKKSIRNIININYNQILSLSIDGVLNIWSLNKKNNLYFCITTVILSKNTNLKYNEILLIDDTKIVYYEIKDQ